MAGILERWELVEPDFQEVYGVDLSDPTIQARPWRWFRVRLIALLSTECRVQRVFNPVKTEKKG